MEKELKKIFKITRGNAECYIVNESSIPIDFQWRDFNNKDDVKLFWDLHHAYNELPGGDYDFFSFCSNVIQVHEDEARKFVQWLRDNRDWDFEAEYIYPYTNDEAYEWAAENNMRI